MQNHGHATDPWRRARVMAVFSRQPLSRLTFLKVVCLQTALSDLKTVRVRVRLNEERARANTSISDLNNLHENIQHSDWLREVQLFGNSTENNQVSYDPRSYNERNLI